jgi:hypothetical protein
MRRLIPLLALGTVVVACAPAPASTPAATPEVVRAVDGEPPFSLVFELPRSTWRAGEAIVGTVTLGVAAGGVMCDGRSHDLTATIDLHITD